MHLRQHPKAAAFGAKLISLNHQVQRPFGDQLSEGRKAGAYYSDSFGKLVVEVGMRMLANQLAIKDKGM
jgi:hypothetical protein